MSIADWFVHTLCGEARLLCLRRLLEQKCCLTDALVWSVYSSLSDVDWAAMGMLQPHTGLMWSTVAHMSFSLPMPHPRVANLTDRVKAAVSTKLCRWQAEQ